MEKIEGYDWYTGVISSSIESIGDEEKNKEILIDPSDTCIYGFVIVHEERPGNPFRRIYRRHLRRIYQRYPRIKPGKPIVDEKIIASVRQKVQKNKMYSVTLSEERPGNPFRRIYRRHLRRIHQRHPRIKPGRPIVDEKIIASVRQKVQKNKMYRVTLSDVINPIIAPIAEEQLDEVMTAQLATVVEDSILEFREQRNRFNSETKKFRDEFQHKFLQLTGGPKGDS